MAGGTLHHILGGVALHLGAADGADGLAYAGKEQAQVFIYLCACAHSASRIACGHLLLDGNGRWNALDIVTLGLVHPAQELTCVGTQALHVASLSLGIKRVKGQRTLSAAAQSRYHNEFAARNLQTDILQVVDSRAFYLYAVLHLSVLSPDCLPVVIVVLCQCIAEIVAHAVCHHLRVGVCHHQSLAGCTLVLVLLV